MHKEPHELSGQTVKITDGEFKGQDYWVEDWWDHLTGGSWMNANGIPACMEYAIRSGTESLPIDNNVVYGKLGKFGKLIHVSQLGEVQTGAQTRRTEGSQ